MFRKRTDTKAPPPAKGALPTEAAELSEEQLAIASGGKVLIQEIQVTSGKANTSEIHIVKLMDKSSPSL